MTLWAKDGIPGGADPPAVPSVSSAKTTERPLGLEGKRAAERHKKWKQSLQDKVPIDMAMDAVSTKMAHQTRKTRTNQ